MSSSNVEGMVRAGIEAARAGRREEAYSLLLRATELDETNETAWLWLAGVVDSPEDQQTCLENVLTINPHNERARRGLETLRAKSQSTSQSPSSAPASPAPTSPPTAASSASPGSFSSDVLADDDELPTGVAWDMIIPSSSPSQVAHVEEPTPAQYDNWVAGLNLKPPSDSALDAPNPVTPLNTLPFVADENLFGFADEDETFTAPRDKTDMLAALRAEVYAEGPFDTDLEDDAAYVSESEAQRPAAAPPAELPQSRLSASPPAFASAADEIDIMPALEADAFAPEMLESYDDAEIGDLDPEEYFSFIPPEIKASRLPGTVERHHPLLLLALVALIGLNVGALLLVINTLTSG
ncbi:MAG: hypothetical protein ACUVSX_09525 [Aggregatilineales bacterium]